MIYWSRWLIILFVQFVSICALEMNTDFWAIYLKEILGDQPREYLSLYSAAVYTLPPLLSIVSIPFWGRLGDQRGHRKMVIISLVGLGLSQFLVFTSTSIFVIIASRILQGVFNGFVTTQQAYALGFQKEYSEEEPGKVISQLQTMTALALVVGPTIGGHLYDYMGFQNLLLLGAVSTFLCIVPMLLLPADSAVAAPDSSKEDSKQEKKEGGLFHRLRLIPVTFIALFLLMALINFARVTDRPVLGLFLEEVHHAGKDLIGYASGATGLGLAISSPLWTMLVKNSKQRIIMLMLCAAVGSAGLFIVMGMIKNPTMFVPVRFCWGICLGALMPQALTLCTLLAESNNYGWVLGLGNGITKLGGSAGTSLGAALFTLVPMEDAPYVVCGLYAVSGVAILAVMLWFRKKQLLQD